MTRSVEEVTKAKTFHSKTHRTMELTRSEDVLNIEAGVSLISNLLPLDPYLWAGTMIFFRLCQKFVSYDFITVNYSRRSVLDNLFEYFP